MEELFRDQFINYDVMAADSVNSLQLKKEVGDKGVRVPPTSADMLIICCDSFATDMSSFMFHKLYNMGISTRLATMSQVGTTADDVGDYIKGDYNVNSRLTYVLLVGDATRVPTNLFEDGTMYTDAGSDLSYSLVSGSDSIPDIFVGRFSARNRSEVQTMVGRTIYYENNLNQSWQYQSIGIASSEACWYVNGSLFDYEYMNSIRNMLLNSAYGMSGVAQLYDSPNTPISDLPTADIHSAINQGSFLVNYIGYGDSEGWDTGTFTINDINLLQNDYKLPFIYNSRGYGVADFTGDFTNTSPPCFAETWLTARNNSTGAPTGAIGVYASSAEPLWIEAIQGQIAFNYMLVHGVANTFGALCYGSSINMLSQVNESQKFIILFWNYFGDPSLAVLPNIYFPHE